MQKPSSRPRARLTAIGALLAAAVLPLGLPGRAAAGEPLLVKGDRVAVVGDSITEQKLYSKYIELYLLACVPQLDLTVCQFGWSGETAPGFANRMENDLVPWRPTVVTTCYGMNDGGYRPYEEVIGKTYEDGTARIQARMKALGARMVVGGPGAVDTDTWNAANPDADQAYNANLAKLSEIAGRLARENGFVFAGLHPLMMDTMGKAKAALGAEYHVCGGDGVHPWANGHLVMAYAFLKAMGLDGDIGTITVDMAGESTGSEGHRIVSAADGVIQIESVRYPFCVTGTETAPGGTRSILPFIPFNRDLNRYVLVVHNLSAAAADVTWGKTTRPFTKAELEAGVNLADAFPDNPFSQPFAVLDGVVSAKQAYETWMIKGIVTHFRGLPGHFPDDAEITAATDTLRSKLLARQADYAAQARAAVVPVAHTIRIVPRQEQ